jgi:hypothetical protein
MMQAVNQLVARLRLRDMEASPVPGIYSIPPKMVSVLG